MRSIRDCMTYQEAQPVAASGAIQAAASGAIQAAASFVLPYSFAPGDKRAPWTCTFVLPNSFAPGDQLKTEAIGEGDTRDDAQEDACLWMMVKLFAHDPSRVLVRPKHWRITIDELVANIPPRLEGG